MSSPGPVILYRCLVPPSLTFLGVDTEKAAMEEAGWRVVTSRNDPSLKGCTVLGRFSVLPYYKELEYDLSLSDARLINTYQQHRFIANVMNYAHVLGDLTPRTWSRPEDVPYQDRAGSFVCKGTTNSRKDVPWRKGMFAPTFQDVFRVLSFLENDSLIADQGTVIREYIPLVTYLEGVTGQPITNEWRVFALHGEVIASGYYWSTYEEETRSLRPASLPPAALECVQEALRRIGSNASFLAVDVAERADGKGWIVVELNDGQMSGLSEIDPLSFYRSLRRICSP